MIILIVLYGFYLVLLLTNTPLMYVIDKTVLLFVWYYFFYKALFLKVVVLEHSFKSGWDLPYQEDDNDDDEHRVLSKRYAEEVSAWFEREKPYLREDSGVDGLEHTRLSAFCAGVRSGRRCLVGRFSAAASNNFMSTSSGSRKASA